LPSVGRRQLVSSYAKCEISISGDMRTFTIKGVAEVSMRAPPNDRRFEVHIRKHDKWVNYGLVDGGFFDCGVTFANKRFTMNFLPPYLICDPEVKKQFEECPGAAAHCIAPTHNEEATIAQSKSA
jgi:hypothetical protein